MLYYYRNTALILQTIDSQTIAYTYGMALLLIFFILILISFFEY
jgi:hypothetical protein